jgi:hypothetical protein
MVLMLFDVEDRVLWANLDPRLEDAFAVPVIRICQIVSHVLYIEEHVQLPSMKSSSAPYDFSILMLRRKRSDRLEAARSTRSGWATWCVVPMAEDSVPRYAESKKRESFGILRKPIVKEVFWSEKEWKMARMNAKIHTREGKDALYGVHEWMNVEIEKNVERKTTDTLEPDKKRTSSPTPKRLTWVGRLTRST